MEGVIFYNDKIMVDIKLIISSNDCCMIKVLLMENGNDKKNIKQIVKLQNKRSDSEI